jgi:hypothetical protein
MKKTIAIIAATAACSFIAFAGLLSLAPVLKDLTKQPVKALTEIKLSLPLATPTPKPTPYWKTEIRQIETNAIALGPGRIWTQPLWISPVWRNARLVGRFTAQGGGGNDVYACVTNQDGLINLKNGHGFNTWYQSNGRVTVDTINAALPNGQSYFVLSNAFSIFANKAVTLDLRIEYEHLVSP